MVQQTRSIGNERLRNQRLLRGWTQGDVARQIGTDGYTVNRWERGRAVPSPYFRQRLCTLFEKNAEELGFLIKEEKNSPGPSPLVSEKNLPEIWNIPYRRNIFFVGRNDVLEQLYHLFQGECATTPVQTQALTGLGGIGKTQTAVEYAYRYACSYQAVLWVQADSYSTLLMSFINLAELLALPEKDEQDSNRIIAAVKNWLTTHNRWLLIFDNVEDVETASDFLPVVHTGNILITTRTQSTGAVAQSIELKKMNVEEGALFLLRRTKIIELYADPSEAFSDDQEQARELARTLEVLPLALDQAAAYIEGTDCGLAGYQERYRLQRDRLLQMRGLSTDHPEAVATTWLLSFERIQQNSKAAALLLQFCAFLYPDAIPEEIFTTGSRDLWPQFMPEATNIFYLDTLISELRKFSLLRRHPKTKMLSIHRLVQAVLLDWMDEHSRIQLVRQLIQAIDHLFPTNEFTNWECCQRCLPHVLACAAWIEQWHIHTSEAAHLLNQAGEYLQDRAQYTQAEDLYRQALLIREEILGPEHPDLATSIDNLATIAELRWQGDEAERLYKQSLAMVERTLGTEHTEVAACLNNLGLFYHKQGKYSQAEPLHERALAIWEQALGAEHPSVAAGLNNLACLYQSQGKYAQAEQFHRRALAIREQAFGEAHPLVSASLRNLGYLYYAQGKYDQAEPLQQRALVMREQLLGPDHPQVATSLKDLALLYHDLEKYELVDPLQQRALAIRQQAFSNSERNPYIADMFYDIAMHYLSLPEIPAQTEEIFRRALAIWEQTLGLDHPDALSCQRGLADLYCVQGKYIQAEQLCEQALATQERVLGANHPAIAHSFYSLAKLQGFQEKYKRAELLYRQAIALWKETIGPSYPGIAFCLHDLALLYDMQGQYIQAEECSLQALTICTHVFGAEHPKTTHYLQHSIALAQRTS